MGMGHEPTSAVSAPTYGAAPHPAKAVSFSIVTPTVNTEAGTVRSLPQASRDENSPIRALPTSPASTSKEQGSLPSRLVNVADSITAGVSAGIRSISAGGVAAVSAGITPTIKPLVHQDLYTEGDLMLKQIRVRPPRKGRHFHVYCSRHNLGCAELFDDLVISNSSPFWPQNLALGRPTCASTLGTIAGLRAVSPASFLNGAWFCAPLVRIGHHDRAVRPLVLSIGAN